MVRFGIASSPYLFLVPVLTLAAVLRVANLGDRDLWLDEALSALYVSIPLDTLVELRRNGTNPPLYHVLLGAWVWVFGGDEWGLRMMSAVAGVAAVGLMFPLGCRLGGTRCGLIACALMAVNNWAVCYSQEARYYALTEALAVLTTLLLHDALTARRLDKLAGFTLASVAAVWVHSFAWLVLAAQAVWVVLRMRSMIPADRRRWTWLFSLAAVAVVLSFLPWIPVLLDQVSYVASGYWIEPPRWTDLSEWARGMVAPWPVLRSAVVAVCAAGVLGVVVTRGSAGNPDRVREKCGGLIRTPDAKSGALGAAGARAPHLAWGNLKRPAAPPDLSRSHGDQPGTPSLRPADATFLLLWLLLPCVLPMVWSLVGPPIFKAKYAIVSQPAAALLLALLVTRRPAVGCVFLAAAVLVFPARTGSTLVREDWRAAARVIESHYAPAAPIFVYRDYCYFPLHYYLDDPPPITPVAHPEHLTSEFVRLYPQGAVPFEAMLAAAESDREVWIVLSHAGFQGDPPYCDALARALRKRHPGCTVHAFKEVEVWHCAGSVVAVQDEVGQDGE